METRDAVRDADAEPREPVTASDSPVVDRLSRMLRIDEAERTEHADAHRAMRIALVISGVRCIVAYVLVPFVVPLVSFLGAVAAPLGILLCLVGIANAVLSIRRFHAADHPRKWVYTAFMAVVLVMLVVAMSFDVVRLLAL